MNLLQLSADKVVFFGVSKSAKVIAESIFIGDNLKIEVLEILGKLRV